ncbi:heavy-metal-associated domain-containing protein [Tenacibaculum sp. ZS6-P6]|uniref:heavy-metal-associated domain-containing protein n=1 Tax=Tenacibaculum sp. ZS6-P6 TaxID=3447503 RepID=UPI003F9AD800
MKKYTIVIQNLKCSGCSNTIKNKLNKVHNISEVSIDIENSIVSFRYKNDNDIISVKKILSNLGYPDENDTNSIGKKVKSFISCANGKMNN